MYNLNMTYTEKLIAEVSQQLQLNNKLLNEILENTKMMQKDIVVCTKTMTASNIQNIKESRIKTQQMMKMLFESNPKKAK